MPFSVKKNLTALYFIKIAKWMNLVMPVIVLFYNSNGLDMQEIFQLQAIYSLTLMTLEIPTGYFADLAGRRTSLLIGSCFGFLGYVIFASSMGFWMFVVAEVVLGIGQSLISGADSAMLYDTLASRKLSRNYPKLEGRITSLGNFAEAFAGVFGGALALISLRTPFIVQAVVAFIAVPAAFYLQDPPVHIAVNKPRFRDIFSVVRNTLVVDRKLRWNTLFSAFTGASTLTMAWFAQPFFISVDMPLSWYGTAWALLNLAVGLAAIQAYKIDRELGTRKTVVLFTILIISGFIALSLFPSIVTLAALLVFYLARGVATPLLRNYINVITTSESRATVLSVRNFIIRMSFAILGPLFGWITDYYGLQEALMAAGVIFGLLNGISLYYFVRYKTYRA